MLATSDPLTIWDHSLTELFTKGGPLMWPLLACSVVAVALFIDRLVALARVRLDFAAFTGALGERVRRGELQKALALCRAGRGPVARAALAYLENAEASAGTRASVVSREGEMALEDVEDRLGGLATIAQVATLLGLLGTVAGLVSAFHEIELSSGAVQPGDLAEGIWEALLTTVFGLSIAIPSLIASHWFESRVDAVTRRMGFIVSFLDEWLGTSTTPDAVTAGRSGTRSAAGGPRAEESA